jgi:organic radical activating enzyme
LIAEKELGTESFNKHFREVFGIPCLDFVNSIVINLPEPCYANCEYCIDNYLRKKSIDNKSFLDICEKVLQEFPNANSVAITGGSLNFFDFNYLLTLIKTYLPNSYINWNTNGVGINEDYLNGILKINHVNLHRNSMNEDENERIFKATRQILSLSQAKELIGDRLCLRVTIDETFDIDEYSKAEIPLYLNRLLPGTKETDEVFNETLKKLNISDDVDQRRRNVYLNANYQGVPVRICMGDKLATHVPNRRPTFLNVAIVHRSGIVCGSWFEDDKVIYLPNTQLKNTVETDKDISKKLLFRKVN